MVFPSRDPRDLITDAILQHLRSMGVKAEPVPVENPGWGSMLWIFKIADRDIDSIKVDFRPWMGLRYSTPADYWGVAYLVLGRGAILDNTIKAKTKKIKELWWGNKVLDVLTSFVIGDKRVLDVRWVGGPIVQSLNRDTELSRLLIEAEETKIRIEPDKQIQWVAISTYHDERISLSEIAQRSITRLISEKSFLAYKRIAKHIRDYLGIS